MALHGAPADFALDELGHGPNVEQTRGVRPAAEDQPREPERLPHTEPEHLRQLEIVPQLHEAPDAEPRIAGMRREIAGVDRADARAAEDVDVRRPSSAQSHELAEDVREDADLVRA